MVNQRKEKNDEEEGECEDGHMVNQRNEKNAEEEGEYEDGHMAERPNGFHKTHAQQTSTKYGRRTVLTSLSAIKNHFISLRETLGNGTESDAWVNRFFIFVFSDIDGLVIGYKVAR
ncbi:hypothetical protein AVEN_72253-1 [Araneus ventricosus]|uniref:Uncharacterized protein n=1 Tax=Araneus ventricosus TaxID=182803 RepID=A0A4Y2GT89_ARAVE|nr:hypothetical protein AVEN_72253-1 [Araneus ventricosus]